MNSFLRLEKTHQKKSTILMLIVVCADYFIKISLVVCIVQSCSTATHIILFTVSQGVGLILRTIVERQLFGVQNVTSNIAPSFASLVRREEVR